MKQLRQIYPELKQFKSIVERDGFNEKYFNKMDNLFQELHRKAKIEEIPVLTKQIHEILGNENIYNSIQGFAYRKPHGYAGDYEIIDKMYRQEVHKKPEIAVWDQFYHFNAAAKAVRNRKEYFKALLKKFREHKEELYVLNLASGPCRDIFEYFEETNDHNVYFDCVDMDRDAIEYAKTLNRKYLSNINFIKENIYKFVPPRKYNLIWSAGLFDYFNDSVFATILRRVSSYCREKGKMVIGNFSDNNPTQGYMLIMADWKLNLRSEKKLRKIAIKAGIKKEQCQVEKEPLGINLFLRINF